MRALAATIAASLLTLASCATSAALARAALEERASTGIDLAQLPATACATLALIQKGGPFPYPQDGATFSNREQRLPPQRRGYYTEYTVRTPGSHDRGARRMIAGRGAAGDSRRSGEYWYTDDHYRKFRRVRVAPIALNATRLDCAATLRTGQDINSPELNSR